jgi:lysophospholipid acyltransferase (LPLAT)-like uncharacterized protein
VGVKHVLLGALGALYMRSLRLSWRIDERPSRYIAGSRASRGTGAMYLMWHSRIILGAATQIGLGVHVIVSRHSDGEYIHQAVTRMGYGTVRGSSSRGGGDAFKGLLRVLRGGGDVVMAPDGPRGPRMSLAPGCVLIAMRARVPLVPVGIDCRRKKRLRSWDRFIVPWWFTKVAVRFGEPIDVPRGFAADELDAFVERVRQKLIDLTAEASESLGVPVETPDVDPLDRGR